MPAAAAPLNHDVGWVAGAEVPSTSRSGRAEVDVAVPSLVGHAAEAASDGPARHSAWPAQLGPEPDTPSAPAQRNGWRDTPAIWAAALQASSAPAAREINWPSDQDVPAARMNWPARHASTEPAHLRPAEPAVPTVPTVLRRPAQHAVDPAHPQRRTISADMVLDTVPMGRVRHRRADALSSAIVYALPDTPPSGLRKFDLGTVPASVTPPRSWRRAAWFAVGTSAAVVLGLAVASAELMGRPVDGSYIDALPAYPSGPMTLAKLPNQQTTDVPGTSHTKKNRPPSSGSTPTSTEPNDAPPRDTVIGNTTDPQTDAPSSEEGTSTTTTPVEPPRVTVGAAPVTPTNPQAMGDRTEEYFKLVTSDPSAAHAMTTGGMAREGAEGIEARYDGVERVEVQDITIDQGQGVTTSTVKVVHEDGSETIEERQLTFTWGGDPKITEDAVTP
jgi:hypothetical protein